MQRLNDPLPQLLVPKIQFARPAASHAVVRGVGASKQPAGKTSNTMGNMKGAMGHTVQAAARGGAARGAGAGSAAGAAGKQPAGKRMRTLMYTSKVKPNSQAERTQSAGGNMKGVMGISFEVAAGPLAGVAAVHSADACSVSLTACTGLLSYYAPHLCSGSALPPALRPSPTRWHSQLLGAGCWDSLGAWVATGVGGWVGGDARKVFCAGYACVQPSPSPFHTHTPGPSVTSRAA